MPVSYLCRTPDCNTAVIIFLSELLYEYPTSPVFPAVPLKYPLLDPQPLYLTLYRSILCFHAYRFLPPLSPRASGPYYSCSTLPAQRVSSPLSGGGGGGGGGSGSGSPSKLQRLGSASDTPGYSTAQRLPSSSSSSPGKQSPASRLAKSYRYDNVDVDFGKLSLIVTRNRVWCCLRRHQHELLCSIYYPYYSKVYHKPFLTSALTNCLQIVYYIYIYICIHIQNCIQHRKQDVFL